MTEVIILAAGKGTRMKDVLTKALIKVKDKPMISYGIETVARAGFDKPIIVVGDNEASIREVMGEQRYVRQEQQLGTGHAVKTALSALKPETKHVIVWYCDHPLITAETLQTLLHTHTNQGGVLTMAVAKVNDFDDWRNALYVFGRIIRNEKGNVAAIIEKKDATPEQLLITEVNPAYFCFDRTWLEKAINLLTNDNVQKEYYLTDLVKLAFKEEKGVADIIVSAEEAMGANTKEDVATLEALVYPRTL